MRCPICLNYVHQCGKTAPCVPFEPRIWPAQSSEEQTISPSEASTETVNADPTATPVGRLLAAASFLAQAASGVIENARAETLFAQDVAAFAADPDTIHPLGDELDAIAEALTCLHLAIGEPLSTDRLANAAERWVRGDD